MSSISVAAPLVSVTVAIHNQQGAVENVNTS
jgi:hypothetical protein